jgi:hypothetical protein
MSKSHQVTIIHPDTKKEHWVGTLTPDELEYARIGGCVEPVYYLHTSCGKQIDGPIKKRGLRRSKNPCKACLRDYQKWA